jgi:DNA-binding transcriptional LysR family regulator
MNITAIHTFLTVMRTGNLNRAAEALNITQSAVTARLDALETQLGAQLLVRARSGARLTKAGYAFVDTAEMIVQGWDGARARLSLPQGVTRLLSVACAPDLWAGTGDGWIEDLRKRHGEIAIEVWPALQDQAQGWLASGLCDVAVTGEPVTGAGIDHRALKDEPLIQVANKPRHAVAWDPTYIYVDYGPGYRARHAALWQGEETAALSLNAPDWALAHLLAHGGSAYLPSAMASPQIAAGRLFEVAGAPPLSRRSYISWRKSSEADFPWLGNHAPAP